MAVSMVLSHPMYVNKRKLNKESFKCLCCYLPKSCTWHGSTIVSPITTLYDWPLDTNFGWTVGDSKSKEGICKDKLLSIEAPENKKGEKLF